jgi:hypothetical protein
MIASAGFEPVWRALVIQPIFNYGGQGQPPWGYSGAVTAGDAALTYPRLLALLPAVLVSNAVRLLSAWARRSAGEDTRDLALLTVLCLTSMMSIAYFPDFIHIAFISPLFFVAIAESYDRLARLFSHTSAAERISWATALLAFVLAAAHLADNRVRLRARYRFARATEFGRVDYARRQEAQLYDELHRRLAGEEKRQIFTYPGFLNFYLTLGARNPTRFQFFFPGYNSPDQVASVVADLESSKPPYIVVAAKGFLAADDPVWSYIRRTYAPLSDTDDVGALIYRRRTLP